MVNVITIIIKNEMKKVIFFSILLYAFCFLKLNAQMNVTNTSRNLSANTKSGKKLSDKTETSSSGNSLQKPQCWRWEQMKPSDLELAIKTVPVAYLVVSPLEWHGEAMSFGCDPAIGTAIAEKTWHEIGGVLIPTLYIGAETQYRDWTQKGLTDYWGMEWITKEHNPGSLYISPMTLELVMREMLSFIEIEGFKVCVIISGHGGVEHVKVLHDLEQRAEDRPMKIIYSRLPENKKTEELEFPGSGGHADFSEVSVLGSVDSTMVDKSKFGRIKRDNSIGLMEKNISNIDFNRGKVVIDSRVSQIIKALRDELKNK
jgi:creatinine amidohydrolase